MPCLNIILFEDIDEALLREILLMLLENEDRLRDSANHISAEIVVKQSTSLGGIQNAFEVDNELAPRNPRRELGANPPKLGGQFVEVDCLHMRIYRFTADYILS